MFSTLILALIILPIYDRPAFVQSLNVNNLDKNITKLDNQVFNNSNDYFDYEEIDATNERELTFLDKWRELYDQGKNITLNKHVNHINETFDSLKILKKNFEYLFKSTDNNRDQLKAVELI